MYTADMLQILYPIEGIRRRPQMYLPFGGIKSDHFAVRLVFDILCLSAKATAVMQFETWWIVASEEDWIETFRGDREIETYFKQIVAFPEAGANSFHGEVLLTAFATNLITATPHTSCLSLLGSLPDDELFTHVSRSLPNWQRLVAFQL